jgi:hypothetical protein
MSNVIKRNDFDDAKRIGSWEFSERLFSSQVCTGKYQVQIFSIVFLVPVI